MLLVAIEMKSLKNPLKGSSMWFFIMCMMVESWNVGCLLNGNVHPRLGELFLMDFSYQTLTKASDVHWTWCCCCYGVDLSGKSEYIYDTFIFNRTIDIYKNYSRAQLSWQQTSAECLRSYMTCFYFPIIHIVCRR